MRESVEILKKIQESLLSEVSLDFKRDYFNLIDWDLSLIGLIGERWVWKTTIMLQKLKEDKKGFYFSADNSLVKSIWIFKLIFYLYENFEINIFYIDEIHKYKNWQQEIKNIYDSFPKVKVVFSGSSSLDLYKWILDLWRRASFYNIYPLNFSEFLKYHYGVKIPSFSFEEIIKNHRQISFDYSNLVKESYLEDYLRLWYYPFSKGLTFSQFIQKLQILLDRIILEDLPVFLNFKVESLDKLRKMFYFFSNIPPSDLNFTVLGKKIWLDKNVVENALLLLDKIWLVALIPKWWNLSDKIRKQYKILFWNPNLYFSYSINPDIGVLRESFFVSQIRKIPHSQLYVPKKWDFILQIWDKIYHFEIWWKRKRKKDYWGNVFVVKDNILISEDERTIPLWVLGLLRESKG